MKKRLVLVSDGDVAGEGKMSDTESLDEVATLDFSFSKVASSERGCKGSETAECEVQLT